MSEKSNHTPVEKYPRYYQQINSESVVRLDDAENYGFYLRYFDDIKNPPEQSCMIDLDYVTNGFPQNWREITEAEALSKCEGGDVVTFTKRPDNAHLIAAAPDLLSACKAVCAMLDAVGATEDEQDAVKVLTRAIDKAERRTL